jgi:hypothetical protein
LRCEISGNDFLVGCVTADAPAALADEAIELVVIATGDAVEVGAKRCGDEI